MLVSFKKSYLFHLVGEYLTMFIENQNERLFGLRKTLNIYLKGKIIYRIIFYLLVHSKDGCSN